MLSTRPVRRSEVVETALVTERWFLVVSRSFGRG